MPPPTGVVSGPLIATLYALAASSVSVGSHSPVRSCAFSPARTSNQTTRLRSPKAFFTAASKTRTDARQMSRPIPSPSMNGMMGSSGTSSAPSGWRVMAVPWVGASRFLNSGMVRSLARWPRDVPVQG